MELVEIDIPALNRLRGYLDAVSDFIRTDELKRYFEARLFEIEGPIANIKNLIEKAYPTSKPDRAEVAQVAAEEVMNTFQHELGRFPPPVERLMVLRPVTVPDGGMWQLLKECVDYEQSQ